MRRPGGAVLAVLCAALLTGCTTTLTRSELAVEYYNLGNAYFDLGRYERSAEFLARAIALDDSLARAGYNLARAYAMVARYGEAVDLLEELLSGDPDNVVLLSTIAYVEYARGDLKRSADYYDRALAVNPASVELLENRSIVAEQDGDQELLVDLLGRAVALEPSRSGLLLRLAEAQAATGNRSGAVATLHRYRSAEPGDTGAAFLLAELLVAEEFVAEALGVLSEIEELDAATDVERGRAAFLRSTHLVTLADEPDLGAEALERAIGYGFADAERVSELLTRDISGRARITEILRRAGLLPVGTDSTTAGPPDPDVGETGSDDAGE